MDPSQKVATRNSTATGTAEDSSGPPEGRARDLPIAPPVDIFEDAHQITVQAEMPGVSKQGLNVQADRNTLVIEGDAVLDLPSGMAALYADLQTLKYRRTFVLSGELEAERIEATLKDGVVTVRIPKRMEYRTRKIKVNVS